MRNKESSTLITEEKDSFSKIESKYLVDVFICATIFSMMINRSISLVWVFILCLAGAFYCFFKAQSLIEVYSIADSLENGAKAEFKVNGEVMINVFVASFKDIEQKKVRKDIKGFMVRAYVLSMVASVTLIVLIHARLTT